jgi:hypothetical protein
MIRRLLALILLAALLSISRTVPSGRFSDAEGFRREHPDWWAQIVSHIETDKRKVHRWEADGRLVAHGKGWRAFFDARGVEVVEPEKGAWRWRFDLDAPPAEPRAEGNRVVYDRGGCVEEVYENRAEGLEQIFVIKEPPTGGIVGVAGRVSGIECMRSGRNAMGFGASGSEVLCYSDLKVQDADGRALGARMSYEGGLIAIRVEEGGRYPIVIDPLITAPAWQVVGAGQTNGHFGYVSGAGDVNGDGFGDVVVGECRYDGAAADMGKVYVFLGSQTGLTTSAAWQMTGSEQAGAVFGMYVSGAGDVNGDGFSDVIVSECYYDGAATDMGKVFVFLGSATGLTTSAAWQVEGSGQTNTYFGVVSGAGDVNGDGFSDVIVGEGSYDGATADMGKAYVFLGSATGLTTSAPWQMVGASQATAYFGYSVSGAGDVNGDGFSDVIVSEAYYDGPAVNTGKVYVFLGSATGLTTSAAWQKEGANQLNGYFGWLVSGAGDVNGDGFSDVIVTEPLYDGAAADMGKAYVFLGSATGLTTSASWQVVGASQASGWFGINASGAGDVNGDGYSDVIVGEHLYDGAAVDMGKAYVFLGSPTGLTTSAAWQMMGASQAGAVFGNILSAAGDVNGDGFSDVIVGEILYDGAAADMGKAYVFLGGVQGMITSAPWQVLGAPQSDGYFGTSVSGAGDVNGDGFSDVIVGELYYDGAELNMGKAYVFLGSATGLTTSSSWEIVGASQANAEFGLSVSGAGDVNGDGFSDVIVGERRYDGAAVNMGKAYVFLGSSGGLSTSAAWQVVGASQANAEFGFSVSGARDVNGDGYGDVIVGELGYDGVAADTGKAYVFLGSATGLTTGSPWEMTGSGQTTAYFGGSVSGAGDVNADGFSDVIVGEGNYNTWAGKAYIFLGSATGLTTAASWQVTGAGIANYGFGYGAGAGDVNGDGFGDVIVGENGNDGVATDAGKAYVYLGSATGLSTGPSWEMTGSGQFEATFGNVVSCAGDVNGDGFSDVVVAEYSYSSVETKVGKAYVFLGSTTGLSGGAIWQMTGSGQPHAHLGSSVSGAGDVNGDGFGDVVAGEVGFDGAGLDWGKAYVFLGGEPPGGTFRLAQFQADGVTPLPHGGIAGGSTTVVLKGTLVSSPLGQKVALEFEVKPVGIPFDGAGILQSPFVISGTNPHEVTAMGLAPNTAYRWRARPAYSLSTSYKGPLFGRWLTFEPRDPAGADFRIMDSTSPTVGSIVRANSSPTNAASVNS